MTFDDILNSYKYNPRDVITVPTKGSGKWFRVYAENGNLYVDRAKYKSPSSKMKNRIKINPNEFKDMLPLYKRRLVGESVSDEATNITFCQVYWYGIFNDILGFGKINEVVLENTEKPKQASKTLTTRNNQSYNNIEVPSPSKEEVLKYLAKWDSLEDYTLQENSINKLFKAFPNNTEIEDILFKCATLNDFYSTNIFKIFNVAKHILELDVDKRLKIFDPTLVNDIAKVEINGKEKNFYSFATKYCSHHNELNYPIYDDYVRIVLLHFNKIDKFAIFSTNDLKDYPKFKSILLRFRQFYHLEEFNLKQLDKYLWQLGKDYFPKY